MPKFIYLFIITGLFSLFPEISSALEPEEILVIANNNASKSRVLATYYMKRREIPDNNLCMVRISDQETCKRVEYITKIAIPVRKYLKQIDPQRNKIRCLVVMYGLPLRIVPQNKDTNNNSDKIAGDKVASLDSELMLIYLEEDYPIGGWIPNPYFIGFKDQELSIEKEKVLLVSRLDGPTDIIVKRIIDDSIDTEKKGLQGKAYFDARWTDPGKKELTGYKLYDRSIHLAAKSVEKNITMDTILNDTDALFKRNSCPQAALYCGWYSLAKYVVNIK